jgi:hypothetical protein
MSAKTELIDSVWQLRERSGGWLIPRWALHKKMTLHVAGDEKKLEVKGLDEGDW